MFDVLALGEALIDFTPAGLSPSKMNLYERNPGGAPANVLCALSRLGRKTAFIGKVGDDAHGRFLRAVLEENNVDTQGLVADASVFTTLAFVELSGGGERSFSFARKPGADARLTPEELRLPLLENCRIFHFGSLSLTDSPSRAATLEALAAAQKAGAYISFDPNYRAGLWDSEAEAVFTMRASLALASLVKISLEEMFLLTNKEEEREGARFILDRGASCVVITMGARGAAAFTR
ncbi:MAG: carbohydrate kinase, partial [Spirochaetaceae bacterium]|nr:carbohydrate kinase [Spirochaetaceae bacterium]